MQRILFPFLLFTLFFTCCEREDFTIVKETERPDPIVVIGEGSEVFFRTVISNDTLLTTGEARYDRETRQLGISSAPVGEWRCPDPNDPTDRSFGWFGNGTGVSELLTMHVEFTEDGSIDTFWPLYFSSIGDVPVQLEPNCQAPRIGITLDTVNNQVYGILTGQMVDTQYQLDNGFPEGGSCSSAALYPLEVVFQLPLTYCD